MIKYYDIYLSGLLARPTEVVNQAKASEKELPIKLDATCVTLAQYDRVSKSVITAHNISEYRQRKFNIMLLPNIQIMFDALLEGVTFKK